MNLFAKISALSLCSLALACPPAYCEIYDFVFGGPPKAPDERYIKILESPRYAVGYEEDAKNPAWVVYKFGKQENYYKAKRKGKFKTDDRTKAKVTHDDYSAFSKTYDRGHMAPSYGMGVFFGTEGSGQTFVMSNVIPQTKKLNQGIWRGPEYLEAENYGKVFDDLWVITGPIYDDKERLSHGIKKPTACFKILVMKDEADKPHAIAFIFPQELDKKESIGLPKKDTANKIYEWVLAHCTEDGRKATVQEVEKRTGLKFFTELPKSMQERLRKSDEALWDTAELASNEGDE